MEEFVKKVKCESSDRLWDLRKSLFLDVVSRNLADSGDVLVSRKKVWVGKTVKEKHIEDIWMLGGAIKRYDSIPWTLLKNGKWGKEEFAKSQAKQREKECMSVIDCIMADALLLGQKGNGCVDPECKSTGLKDLATVSRAGDNGVTGNGDNGINHHYQWH